MSHSSRFGPTLVASFAALAVVATAGVLPSRSRRDTDCCVEHQFFKDFSRAFFRDFLELFYPEISARLDFGTLRFLEKELFTDFPEGSLREADVVAELETRDGAQERTQHYYEVPHVDHYTRALDTFRPSPFEFRRPVHYQRQRSPSFLFCRLDDEEALRVRHRRVVAFAVNVRWIGAPLEVPIPSRAGAQVDANLQSSLMDSYGNRVVSSPNLLLSAV